MRKPVKKSRQLGGDLDKGGGSGDGAQQVDWSHGLNSEALVTILKYRSDHVAETSHHKSTDYPQSDCRVPWTQ